MAQDSWNKKINETEYQKCDNPILCANNCGFFGSVMTSNFCSKCYREMNQQMMEATQLTAVASSAMVEPVREQLEKLSVKVLGNLKKNATKEPSDHQHSNHCLICRKRMGLTGFKCRCGSVFCSTHRYPETHECSFDFKTAGVEAIAKANPVMKAEKIEKI